jgi:hypothetical protein
MSIIFPMPMMGTDHSPRAKAKEESIIGKSSKKSNKI